MSYRKLAEFAIRRFKGIIMGWLVVASLAAAFAFRLPEALGDHGLETKGDYAQAQKVLQSEFRIPDDPVVILFENAQDNRTREFQTYVMRFLAKVEAISGVDIAVSPLERRELQDDRYAYALVSVKGSSQSIANAIDEIRSEIRHDPRFPVWLTGKPVVQEDVNRSSRHDLKTAETLGIPVAFVLLLLTFGGLIPALIPIVAGFMSVIIAMGVMYGIGVMGIVPLSIFVYNVIPMVGMAVCIDFALLMVSRFRKEKASHSAREALIRTSVFSGKAVTVSVVCVILALLGTLFIRMPIFNSVALSALVVVATSALINLTFVPALLYALGPRIGARSNHVNTRNARSYGQKIVGKAMSRPVASVFAASAILIVCLLPIREMRMTVPGPESLPATTVSREAAAIVADRFLPSGVSRLYMIADERSLDRIRSDLERDRLVIRSIAERSHVNSDRYLLTIELRGAPSSEVTRRWIREQEERFKENGVLVGGEAKYRQEVHDEIFGRMKYVLAFVVGSNFIVLAWAFRSLLIPVKAILMNLLSIGASFGIVAWLFKQGIWGIEPSDIAIMIPIFVFGLTFGISMDYGIFLYASIFESYDRTKDNDVSVREGMAGSAPIIISAAAIMIAVTAPFALAGVSGVKQLGIAIATALFIDATVIRLILVPALMKMLGKWNWWIPFVRS